MTRDQMSRLGRISVSVMAAATAPEHDADMDDVIGGIALALASAGVQLGIRDEDVIARLVASQKLMRTAVELQRDEQASKSLEVA